MAMKINVQLDQSALKSFLQLLLKQENFGIDPRSGCLPLPIKIVTTKTGSVVAKNDAIWVEHRDKLENVLIAKRFSDFIVSEHELDHAMDDI